jgi:hypothetical protein
MIHNSNFLIHKIVPLIGLSVFTILGFLLTVQTASASVIIQRPLYIGLTSGLVGNWTFDGPTMSGTRAHDTSGQGNHGALTNGPTRAAGKIGQALEFDGVNDFVNAGSGTSLHMGTGDYSMSLWIKQVTTGVEDIMIANGAGTAITPGAWFSVVSTGKARINVSDGSSYVVNNRQSVKTVDDNTWHHVVWSWDRDVGHTFYIDGAFDTSYADINSSNIGGAWAFGIGDRTVGTIRPFNGLIDDVRIYNRALSPTEIKRLHKIGGTMTVNKAAYTGSLEEGLVGAWDFEGPNMNATQALDSSGQGNHGTLSPPAGGGPQPIYGKLGQALEFDGVDDHVFIPDSPSLDLIGGDFAFAAWAKLSSCPTSNGKIVEQQAAGANAAVMHMECDETDGSAEFTLRGELGGTIVTLDGTSDIVDDTWHHIVTQREGDRISIFVDGIEENFDITNIPKEYDGDIYIGTSQDGGARFTDGLIDDVLIYNRILTEDEIKRLANAGGTLKINTTNPGNDLNKPESGLVGWWTFDGPEASQGYVLDRSGQGNRGTLSGGPAPTYGKLGQALDFDSNDDYVLVPNTASIDTDNFNGLTVSAWINPRSHGEGTDGRIADKSHNASATHDGWVFDVTDSGGERKLRFIADHSTTDLFRRSVAGVWNLNTWQHVLVTWDKSTAAANVHIYVNGTEVSYSLTTDGDGTFGDTRDLYIGNAHNVARTFDGALDDVRIYNRVLTSEEIKRLYIFGR